MMLSVGIPAGMALAEGGSADIAKKAIPAVVLIKGTTTAGAEVGGSGFIVDPSGTIVTNLHVIQDLKARGVRLANGDIYDQFKIRAFDERKDLAVIQIAGFELPHLELGNSDNLNPGDQVLLVGNPLGLEGSVSAGVVSGIRNLEEGYRVIQTDAAANPGNSGGPLLDAQGRAVGVLTFKARGTENLNFVLPINYVRGLLVGGETLTLEQLRTEVGKQPVVFGRQGYPARWKSLASGTVKILRVDGDNLYVETVLPEERTKVGDFFLADLKKVGETYVGKVRSAWTCQYGDGVWTKIGYNKCMEEVAIEITMLTATRLEGSVDSYPQNDKVKCRTCTHSEGKEKASFVWIPE